VTQRLIIKHPKPVSKITGFILGVPLAIVVLWFFRLLERDEDIHFENPWANLAVHSALILAPILLTAAISLGPMHFTPTEETVLCYSSYLKTFRASWWTLLPVWPAGIFAAFILLRDLFTQHLAHPDVLMTSPLRALLVVGVAFGVSLLYSTILFNRSEVRVSADGLRPGLIRFLEWESIHHVSQEGEIYSFYHRARPNLPVAFIPVRSEESKATLDRFLAQHNVPMSETAGGLLIVMKLMVLSGFVMNLLLCFWLRSEVNLGLLPTIGISMAIGMMANLALDRFRGVSKLTTFYPKIESQVF
jgi:hypothetical protein